jgi:hypothetical protein
VEGMVALVALVVRWVLMVHVKDCQAIDYVLLMYLFIIIFTLSTFFFLFSFTTPGS